MGPNKTAAYLEDLWMRAGVCISRKKQKYDLCMQYITMGPSKTSGCAQVCVYMCISRKNKNAIDPHAQVNIRFGVDIFFFVRWAPTKAVGVAIQHVPLCISLSYIYCLLYTSPSPRDRG